MVLTVTFIFYFKMLNQGAIVREGSVISDVKTFCDNLMTISL